MRFLPSYAIDGMEERRERQKCLSLGFPGKLEGQRKDINVKKCNFYFLKFYEYLERRTVELFARARKKQLSSWGKMEFKILSFLEFRLRH